MGIDLEMVVRVPNRKLSADDVKRVAVRMQIAFGHASGSGVLWVDREHKQHCLELLKPGSWLLEDAGVPFDANSSYVHLRSFARYYGPGYERGDLVAILAVARYLRWAFDPCEVYYGGDCGPLRLMGAQYEAELWGHFVGEHSRAYYAAGPLCDEGTVICDFCDVRTNAHTFCGAEITSSCPSCGQSWTVNRATGEVKQLPSRA